MKSLFSKALFIYLAFHILAILSCGLTCNCKESFFEIKDIEASAFDQSLIGNSIFDLAILTDSSTVSTDNFGILFSFTHEDCAFLQLPDFSSFFVQSALACSCLGPQPCDNMTIFTIKSDADFVQTDGTIKPAGQSLNPVFDAIFPLEGGEPINNGSLDAFITIPQNLLTLDFQNAFALNVEIEPNQTHTFTVELELDDGTKFSTQTATVTFE